MSPHRQTFAVTVEPAAAGRSAYHVALLAPPDAVPVKLASSTAPDDFTALVDAVALIRSERAGNPQPVSLVVTVPPATAQALNGRDRASSNAWAVLSALAPGNCLVKAGPPLG